MIILKRSHPDWEEHKHFDCPACGCPIDDDTERESWQLGEEVSQCKCPACNVMLSVCVTVSVEYDVEAAKGSRTPGYAGDPPPSADW